MGDKRSVCFGMVIAVVGLFHTGLMSMFAELEAPTPNEENGGQCVTESRISWSKSDEQVIITSHDIHYYSNRDRPWFRN